MLIGWRLSGGRRGGRFSKGLETKEESRLSELVHGSRGDSEKEQESRLGVD